MSSTPPATLPIESADRVIERIDAALQAAPEGVLAFDGDGTLWSGDVGEDFFHALVAPRRDFREPAIVELENEARKYGVSLEGNGKLAARIYDAYLAGRFPEEAVCELMTWAFAGWTEREVDAFAADVLSRVGLGPRLHREVQKVIAWARGRGAETFLVRRRRRGAIIEHAGRAVGFDDAHIIAAVPRYADGTMVADVIRPIPYAAGKVHNLRAQIGASRTLLAAFGDNAFDVAMLSQASVPVAVRPKPRLRDRAPEVQKLVEIARET